MNPGSQLKHGRARGGCDLFCLYKWRTSRVGKLHLGRGYLDRAGPLQPLRPAEVALSPRWSEHPTLPVITNSLLIPFKEVIFFLLGSPITTASISSVVMAIGRHIELVRGAPLPGVRPAAKRRLGPCSLCSVAGLSSFFLF